MEEALEAIEQDETPLWAQNPFHSYFIIDEKATFVTTLNSGAGLDFELNMYDFESKLYFANTGGYPSQNLKVEVTGDGIQVDGFYSISQDDFNITNFDVQNFQVDVNIGWLLTPFVDALLCVYGLSTLQGCITLSSVVKDAIENQISNEIENFNDNPNQFIRSFVNIPSITNALPNIEDAIADLLQVNVSANLEIALPSCGDITRDGAVSLGVEVH